MSDHAISEEDLTRLRAILVARRAELAELDQLSQDSRGPVELDQQSVGRLSRMDAMQQQAMALAAQQRRGQDALRIGAALKRMQDGEFGWCGDCGEAIPLRRLDVDPTVPTCIACADGG